jgi:nucleotidyltransferase substrate binding protein (TIGR01987 family)
VAQDDIRWQQRLANYQRAWSQLQAAVALQTQRPLSELEQQGLIQAFEFTHELAWNVMKDYLVYQGRSDLAGSRDATRAAFAVQLIEDGEGWMEMIASRNQTSHTYNRATAEAIVQRITQRYAALFDAFAQRMAHRQGLDAGQAWDRGGGGG